MLECVDCGTENDGSSTLCQGCGKRLLLAIGALDGPGSDDAPVCVRCGCPGRREARFCAICGTPCHSVLAVVPALDIMPGALDFEVEPFGSVTVPIAYPSAALESAPIEPIVRPVIAPAPRPGVELPPVPAPMQAAAIAPPAPPPLPSPRPEAPPPFPAPMPPIAPVPVPAPVEVAAEFSFAAPGRLATRSLPFFSGSPSMVTPVALVVLVALYVGAAVSWSPLSRARSSPAVAALSAAPTGSALAATRPPIELVALASPAALAVPTPYSAPTPSAEQPVTPPAAEPLPLVPTVAPEPAPSPVAVPAPRPAAKAAVSPAAARAAAEQRAKARRERLELKTIAYNAAQRQQGEAQRRQAAEEAGAAQAESQRHAMLALPAAVPVAAPVRVKTTQVREACTGRGNFIARGLCEWRACRHAEHAGEPVCVSMKQAEVRQYSWRER